MTTQSPWFYVKKFITQMAIAMAFIPIEATVMLNKQIKKYEISEVVPHNAASHESMARANLYTY